MTRLLLAAACALACVVLQACGGAGAASSADTPVSTAPLDVNTNGLFIKRAPGPLDSYDGGLRVLRDAYQVQGGRHGFVNSTIYGRAVAGPGQTSFEWTGLFVLDNYSAAGENVAMYAQGNKMSTGPTWGAVAECTDVLGLSGACIGMEVDVWTTGPDNGSRPGVDVIVGDGKAMRGLGRSDVVEGSVGVRVSNGTTPYARWKRGVQLAGHFDVGIDTAEANISTGTAIRLAAGQAISLESTDAIQLKYANGRVAITNGGVPVFEIDANTGDIYQRGKLRAQ